MQNKKLTPTAEMARVGDRYYSFKSFTFIDFGTNRKPSPLPSYGGSLVKFLLSTEGIYSSL